MSNNSNNQQSWIVAVVVAIIGAVGVIIAATINKPTSTTGLPTPTTPSTSPSSSTTIQHFFATSHCSITNVYGYGRSQDVERAKDSAIDNCINKGGVPNCCKRDIEVSQE
jgi:uncharacterized protein YbbK (DUF523 family)